MTGYKGSHAAAQEGGTNKSNGHEHTPRTFKERDELIRDILADKELGSTAKCVGVAIAMAIRVEAGSRDISCSDIAKAAGVTSRSVMNAIPELEARGWLTVKRRVPPQVHNYRMVNRSHSQSHQNQRQTMNRSHSLDDETMNRSHSPTMNGSQGPLYSKSSEVRISEESKSSEGRKIPATALSDEEPAGDLSPSAIIRRLVAESNTVAKPEIEWPLVDNAAGNVVSIKPKRDFDRFWAIFPRDNNNDVKLAAIKFHAACKLPSVTAEIIIAGAQRYAAECAANPQKWKKLAHNWLTGECWNNVPQPSHSNTHRSSSVIDDFGGVEGWMRAALNVEKPQ